MRESYNTTHQMWSDNKFKELFMESLNWDNPKNNKLNVEIKNEQDEKTYSFAVNPVANKRGLEVLEIYCDNYDHIPTYVANQLSEYLKTKMSCENLMIITEKSKNKEIWMYNPDSEKAAVVSVVVDPDENSKPHLMMLFLSQLFYAMKDEENLYIIDVAQRVQDSLSSLSNFPIINSFKSKIGNVTFVENEVYLSNAKIGDLEREEDGTINFRSDVLENLTNQSFSDGDFESKLVWEISNNEQTKEKLTQNSENSR